MPCQNCTVTTTKLVKTRKPNYWIENPHQMIHFLWKHYYSTHLSSSEVYTFALCIMKISLLSGSVYLRDVMDHPIDIRFVAATNLNIAELRLKKNVAELRLKKGTASWPSPVWQYFGFNQDENDNVLPTCKLCQRKVCAAGGNTLLPIYCSIPAKKRPVFWAQAPSVQALCRQCVYTCKTRTLLTLR